MTHPPIPDETERAANEPSDAQIAATLLNDIAPYLGVRGMAHLANATVIAAQRLEAREISEAMVERAVKAACQTAREVCLFPNCLCAVVALKCTRAALEAALSGEKDEDRN